MSATSIGDCPTSNTVGFSITPTTYPAGIAARIPIMSFSRLSSEPALLLLATMAVIAKLSLTCVFALPITQLPCMGCQVRQQWLAVLVTQARSDTRLQIAR
jgi:hypothetical protein